MFNALNAAAEVPVQFNTSVSACYYSTREVKTVLALYDATIGNSQAIKFNLFFNAGLLLTSVKNIYFYYHDV
jgi:hypothetical protein